ncbi:similar to Deadpan [Carabus blaptoides fortunei]
MDKAVPGNNISGRPAYEVEKLNKRRRTPHQSTFAACTAMTAKASANKRASTRSNQQVCTEGAGNRVSSVTSSEPRRANKPLMEKRRRARINQSLAVLKTLILDSAKSDNTKHSKLEKADILELTVRHFQRHRNLDTPGLNKYRAGYADCVREVQRYLETPDAQTMCVIEPGIRQRLLRHLENCVAEIDTDISPPAIVQQQQQQQESIYKEVIGCPVDTKRISISTPSAMDYTPTKLEPLAHISESSLPTDLVFSGNVEQIEPPDEKKVRLEPDSSTAEEINNNAAEPNFRCDNNDMISRMESEVGVSTQHIATLPNNVIRMYDGNFVFVLPSHYIQLAAALGINLNNQVAPVPIAETNSTSETARTQVESQTPVSVGSSTEKPLDYSKNNDMNDSMWRPW